MSSIHLCCPLRAQVLAEIRLWKQEAALPASPNAEANGGAMAASCSSRRHHSSSQCAQNLLKEKRCSPPQTSRAARSGCLNYGRPLAWPPTWPPTWPPSFPGFRHPPVLRRFLSPEHARASVSRWAKAQNAHNVCRRKRFLAQSWTVARPAHTTMSLCLASLRTLTRRSQGLSDLATRKRLCLGSHTRFRSPGGA